MPMIPMKQTVTQIREIGDEWEEGVTYIRTPLKCAINEGAKLVRSMTSSGGTQGVASSEVVSSAQIYLDKIVDIQLTDSFEYTNELGIKRKYFPISIEVKRLSGKPVLTVVNV